MRSPKHTAWKKNRKFGDINGGRMRTKLADNIFHRLHSLSRPTADQEVLILMKDNPGANYYFPVSAEEISAKLKDLPSGDQDGITHIWLRRPSGKEARRGHGLGEFICGRGVHLITLYPWRKDRRRCLGRNRLTGKEGNGFKRFGGRIYEQRGWWYVEFSEPDLKRYFLDTFFHEVGHHIDCFRRYYSPANRKQAEDTADQYAASIDYQ